MAIRTSTKKQPARKSVTAKLPGKKKPPTLKLAPKTPKKAAAKTATSKAVQSKTATSTTARSTTARSETGTPSKTAGQKSATSNSMAAPKSKATKRTAAKSMKAAQRSAIDRLREICLAMPETHEVEAWGEPTFRVKGKIFAMHATASTHHGAGREAIWIAAHSSTQDLVIRAKPDYYFSPPYVGPSGWIGAWIDRKPFWAEIEDFLKDAYRMKAPKKLAALIGED